MNKSYKLVFNKKRGELVVVSEIAKGAKKNSSKKILPIAVALLLLPLSQNVYAENVYLEDVYHAAQLNWKTDEKGNRVVDKTDPIKSGQTKGGLILDTDGDHNISFNKNNNRDQQVQVMNGMEANSSYDNLGQTDLYEVKTFEELIDLGIAGIYKKQDDGSLVEIEKKEVTWTDAAFKDGKFVDVPDDSNGKVGGYKYLDKQPVIPFYQLNMVTAQKGSMNFQESVKWEFGQAKDSQLFIAEDGAHINVKVGAAIDVDFGAQLNVAEPRPEDKKETPFGQTTVWSGLSWDDIVDNEKFHDIYKQNIDDLKEKVANGGYSQEQVDELNGVLDNIGKHYKELEGKSIDSAANANIAKSILGLHLELAGTILPSFNQTAYEEYLQVLEGLVIKKVAPDYVGVIEEIEFDETPLYVNKEMQNNPGRNSLFTSGNGSQVLFAEGSTVRVRNGNLLTATDSNITVEKGSDLTVDGGDLLSVSGDGATAVIEEGAKVKSLNGYIVRASTGADVTNNAAIELHGTKSANATIDNATYQQAGDLYFNMTAAGEKRSGAVGDTVAGKDAVYTNTGNIYSTGLGVAEGKSSGATISAEKGAHIINEGQIYIGALSTEKNERSDGIVLQGNRTEDDAPTSFVNEESAQISVGYDKDDNPVKSFGEKISNMDLRYRAINMNNAILIEAANEQSSIDVQQKGTIKLGNNAAGINLNKGHSDQVVIENSGKIHVKGDYSVGMRINNGNTGTNFIDADESNVKHSGLITVEGENSTGLHVSNNAVAEIAGGTIEVTGTNPKEVSYGVYVDLGKLILKDSGTDKAEIKLSGDGVVGARAVNGGIIKL